MSTLTAHERRRYAIARTRERRERELAPVRGEVDRLVAEVGWHRARRIVEDVLGPGIRVSGPGGKWRGKVGKRTGARLVAALSALPAQGRLALMSQPRRSVHRGGRA